jgi:hypothetical protein
MMPKKVDYVDKVLFITQNAGDFTVKELAAAMELSLSGVYQIGYRHGLTFRDQKKRPVIVPERPKRSHRDPYLPKEPKKVVIQRPAANYSNSGSINTLKKYV